MSSRDEMVPAGLRELWEHPRWAYRGCQPDPEDTRLSIGDPRVPVMAWQAPGEGLPQEVVERLEAGAVRVCGWCPVREACAAYASSTTAGGALREPEGVWGGLRALDRHRALIASRTGRAAEVVAAEVGGVPWRPSEEALGEASGPTKRRVLAALAVDRDAERVAIRAGMDLRTANWHRSALCGLLGLDRETATRDQLLARAGELGVMPVLPEGCRVVRDGRVPVPAAPTKDGARERRIAGVRLPRPRVEQLTIDLWSACY
ncbi:WhiB family transcriptional regulator [Streptomyces sp. NEAU-H3]|uniref:WhiB family transcriptional regulator n=1 Tax=Streptomyces sp. NEAU-H3 TaxID=2720636 RepID=UPI0035B69FD9